MEIKQIVDRMVEIKRESNALQDEYLNLQAKLQVEGESALENTKYKSVSYSGTSGKATVEKPRNIRNHHIFVYIKRTKEQEALK